MSFLNKASVYITINAYQHHNGLKQILIGIIIVLLIGMLRIIKCINNDKTNPRHSEDEHREMLLNLKLTKFTGSYPACVYLLKYNNRNTRTKCEICSKLTINTPE